MCSSASKWIRELPVVQSSRGNKYHLRMHVQGLMLLKFHIMSLFHQYQPHFNTMPPGGGRSGITVVAGVVEMPLSKVQLCVSCENSCV
jgi:hypothetical protein